MYLVLLVFGAVMAGAGLFLTASGLSVHDHVFDAATVTPGIVAVVGGFLLAGLGLALRALQRIEVALAAQAAMPVARADDLAEPALIKEPEPVRPAPKLRQRPGPALRPTLVKPADTDQAEDGAARVPPHFDNSAIIENLDFALSAPARLDADWAESGGPRQVRRQNGAAARTMPRLEVAARPANPMPRPNGQTPDTVWPAAPRSTRLIQPSQTAPAVEPQPIEDPSPAPDHAPEATSADLTVLKSGVVDGMAYTLFSDGSIEAELPQGIVRFGSITELRNHVEHTG
jgi:hypothetical protein